MTTSLNISTGRGPKYLRVAYSIVETGTRNELVEPVKRLGPVAKDLLSVLCTFPFVISEPIESFRIGFKFVANSENSMFRIGCVVAVTFLQFLTFLRGCHVLVPSRLGVPVVFVHFGAGRARNCSSRSLHVARVDACRMACSCRIPIMILCDSALVVGMLDVLGLWFS